MPVAGDEGYEKLVICPYDKAHEIRQGRMQFHLDKCRKNYPNTEMVQCLYNSSHLIPKVEISFHSQEECRSRFNWDRHEFEVGYADCPVKDLVPVNAGQVPDADEDWDNYEAQGSVLTAIKTAAANKQITRMLQCESKAKRKNFRLQERARHQQFEFDSSVPDNKSVVSVPDNKSVITTNTEPLPRPTKLPAIPVVKQDPADAVAAISKQFRTLDLNMKPSASSYAPSEASSMYAGPPSVARNPSNIETTSNSLKTGNDAASPSFRTSTAMSSNLSFVSSRPSTAMSIAASVSKLQSDRNINVDPSEEGFCQIPIPGLGRGKAARRTDMK